MVKMKQLLLKIFIDQRTGSMRNYSNSCLVNITSYLEINVKLICKSKKQLIKDFYFIQVSEVGELIPFPVLKLDFDLPW